MCRYKPARCGAFECSWCRKNQPCNCGPEAEAAESFKQQDASLDNMGCTTCSLGCQVSCLHCQTPWCIPCFYGKAHREACSYGRNSETDRKNPIQTTGDRCSACQGTPEMVGDMHICDGCSKQWCTQCYENYTNHKLSCGDQSETNEVPSLQQEPEESSSESDECLDGVCCAGLQPSPTSAHSHESAISQRFRSGLQPCFTDRVISPRKPGLNRQSEAEQHSVETYPTLPKDVAHPTLRLALIDTNEGDPKIFMREVTPLSCDFTTKPTEYELPQTQLYPGEENRQALERLLQQKGLNTKAMRRAVRRSTFKRNGLEDTFPQKSPNDRRSSRVYPARSGIHTVPVAVSYREVRSTENEEDSVSDG